MELYSNTKRTIADMQTKPPSQNIPMMEILRFRSTRRVLMTGMGKQSMAMSKKMERAE